MFRALAHRNYRLFWAGAFLSNAGTWMQSVAQAWLVLHLTDSAFWLGVDTFVGMAPGLLLTLPGGVIADKVDRKRLLIITQAGAGLSSLVLGALVWRGVVEGPSDVWIVLLLTFVTGACWSISGPAYQAINVDLVGREDLANAIALNSAQFQLARVIGPLLAGVTISLLGLSGCFLANGLSYAAIVLALRLVRLDGAGLGGRAKTGGADGAAEGATAGRRAMWRDLVEGLRYVQGRPRVRGLLLCSAFVCFFGTPYLMLAPVFARDVYGWGEAGLALMMGTAGAGALCGALMLVYLGDFARKGRFVLASALAGGACIAGFAVAPGPASALPLFFATGFSMVCFFAGGNTLLQQLVNDAMRGRVMSMWLLTFIGTTPFGSFLAGWAAARYGPRRTLAACGLVVALLVLWVGARYPRLRET
jgi:MFS family permease